MHEMPFFSLSRECFSETNGATSFIYLRARLFSYQNDKMFFLFSANRAKNAKKQVTILSEENISRYLGQWVWLSW